MESTLAKQASPTASQDSAVACTNASLLHIAKLVGFADGMPLLKLSNTNQPVRAVAQATLLTETNIGAHFVVLLDCGDRSRPVVVGKLATNEESCYSTTDRMEITADEELVFKCGKACIKMTSDGTVAVRGANVITRASHTNRIRGGNVQIN